jgi:hypothetical protein
MKYRKLSKKLKSRGVGPMEKMIETETGIKKLGPTHLYGPIPTEN